MVCPPAGPRARVSAGGHRDVLSYLIAALDRPQSAGRVIEIGGADVLTFSEMMLEYAEPAAIRRRALPATRWRRAACPRTGSIG